MAGTTLESWSDGVNADRNGQDFRFHTQQVSSSDKLTIKPARAAAGWAGSIRPRLTARFRLIRNNRKHLLDIHGLWAVANLTEFAKHLNPTREFPTSVNRRGGDRR